MISDVNSYKIGDVISRVFNATEIVDDLPYKRITIKTKGKGVLLRDEVYGEQIGTKNQFQAARGEFILSKIDALNGAFGIVPESCDGAIITGNFWTYNINEEIALKEYLELLCKGQIFSQFSERASEGSTNRRYLREDKFLNLEIKLPSKPEQERVIKKAASFEERIKELRLVNHKKLKAIKNLIYSYYLIYIENCDWDKLENVAPIIRREVEIEADKEYPEIGLRSFGKGTFHKPTIKGSNVGSKRLYYIQPEDLLFSNIFSWEGAIAVAKPEDDGYVGSHRYITCAVDQKRANPHFLCYHFLTSKGLEDINLASPGSAGRNKTLGLTKLEKIKVPLPDKTLQDKHHIIQTKVVQLEREVVILEQALDALVPSVLGKAFKGEW